MKITNIVRALFLPITLTLLALGCILMFIGGLQWLQLDPRSITRDGLQKPLDFFADCDLKAQQDVPQLQKGGAGGGGGGAPAGGQGGAAPAGGATGTEAGGGGGGGGQRLLLQAQGGGQQGAPKNQAGVDLGTVLAERCKQQQRPYKWLIAITAAEVGLTFLLLFWIIYRASSGLLSWLGIQTAIVMAILIITIYAAMQLQAQTKNLVDCQGWDDATRSQVEGLGLTCYQGGNAPNSLKAFNYWSTIFWVGVGFAMGGLGLLTIMVPLMYWAKVRLLRHGGHDDEEGGDEEAPATSGAYGRGTGAAAGRRGAGDEHARESERDRHHSPYDRSTDRWGSGRAGTAGGRTGTGERAGYGRGGEHEDNEPSILSRMTGGYFETDRDRRERETHGGGGRGYGDRDQWGRDRGDRGGRDEQPSAFNRMTGGYFGTEEDRRKEKEHGRDLYGGQEPGVMSKMTGGFLGGDRERERRGQDREREYGGQRGTTGGVEMQQPSFTDRLMGRSEAQPTAPGGVGSSGYPQLSQAGQHGQQSTGGPTPSSHQSGNAPGQSGTNTSGAPRTTTV